MYRKLSILLTVALVGGLLAIGTGTAQAARPFGIQQFHPNDTDNFGGPCGGGTNCQGDVLSDKFDGIDSLAHLTVVATPETESVTWYACPENFTAPPNTDEPPGPTNAQLSSCNVTIGTDTTGIVPPIGPAASSPADEAYDITWDIPGSLDQQRRDIVALACIGAGQNLDANPNCRADVEQSIFVEDAQTGVAANQTTSGEFGNYRTLQSCIGSTASTCEPAYKAFPHGSPVPNDGFDFRATTSDDVGVLAALVNSPADAQTEPSTANDLNGPTCALLQTSTNFKTWHCVLGDGDIPDDAEMSINLTDISTAGSKPEGQGGYCNQENNPASTPSAQNQVAGAHDGCTLDVHYVVSSSRQVASVVQSFAPNPPSPSASAGCAAPDTDETSQLGTTEDTIICLFDQFTDPFNGPWTESTSGVGIINDCGPEGTAHDHNGDGVTDDCHGATGADGQSSGITLANPTGPTGDQTLTSCHDPQNQTTNPPVANHGCGDATGALVKTLVIHWATAPSEVFLVFNNPPPTNASDPCRTGTTFKRNVVGDHDDITVCTFDSNGNPVPTDTSGARLQWTITGAQGEEPTAVRFNPAPPPDETTGSTARNSAGVDAVQEGDNFINVALLNSNGDVVDGFSLEKQVHAPEAGPASLTLRKKDRQNTRGPGGRVSLGGELKGTAGGTCAGNEGGILVQIHRGSANGPVVASTSTLGGGSYTAIFHIGYRHKVRKDFIATSSPSAECQGATSNAVTVPGFRRG